MRVEAALNGATAEELVPTDCRMRCEELNSEPQLLRSWSSFVARRADFIVLGLSRTRQATHQP
jgi:hypothetical protein